jgi:hypothetical protein
VNDDEWTLLEGDVDGIPFEVEDHLQVRDHPFLPSPSRLFAETLDQSRVSCGVGVSATKRTSGNNDKLTVLMIDYPGYATAYQANRGLSDAERYALPEFLGGGTAAPELGFAL